MRHVLDVRPRGAYSLALTAAGGSDATRRFHDGTLTAAVRVGERIEPARAAQLPDGRIRLHAPSREGLDALRAVLALEDDHSEFLRRFARDPLLGPSTLGLRGLRILRVPTVAQALLRALCGQLIEAPRARRIETLIVRATTPADPETLLHAPPTASCLARLSPAELRALGLHARRGAALVRLCRAGGLERFRDLPTALVAERIERERGLGPWSAGVVCVEGLGRPERGLVGDLGLVRLLAALRGRRVEAWETAELLEPYAEWAGLASVFLLKGFGRGLVPLPAGHGARGRYARLAPG